MDVQHGMIGFEGAVAMFRPSPAPPPSRGRGRVRRGLIAGIFCSDGPAAARRASEGFHLVTPGNDAALLRATLSATVRATRGAVG